MIFKKSQSLQSYLNGVSSKTMMILSSDVHSSVLGSHIENLSILIQNGLDFIDADHETTNFLRHILKECVFEQIVLVYRYPCTIHRHLNKGLKPSAKWMKTAERTKYNFLKLEDDGIKQLSDKEFSLIHLQQQLSFFQELLEQECAGKANKPIIKGLLSDKFHQVQEVEVLKFEFNPN